MKRQAGFTLIELAVVVFLIGLLATMGISALKAQLASAAISATKKKQETIKDALVAYLAKNKRLPCPAIDISGYERRTANNPPNCTTYFGIVPYAELGLPKSAAIDGWDNFFTYAVSFMLSPPNNYNWTATFNPLGAASGVETTIAANGFNVGNYGSIFVYTRAPDGTQILAANPAPPPNTGAVVVLTSYGTNGNGAYTTKGTQNAPPAGTDEIANALPQATLPITSPVPMPSFYQRDYTENANASGGAYDDIVIWLSPSDLLNTLIKDRALQSAYGQWADQVASIQDWIAANISPSPTCGTPTITQTTSTPPGFPQNLRVDPWGNQLNASGSLFTYATVGTFSSSVHATYTLANTTPSAAPSIVTPSGAMMIRIYPFLNNGC